MNGDKLLLQLDLDALQLCQLRDILQVVTFLLNFISSAHSLAISVGNKGIASAGAIYTPQFSDFEIGDLALPKVISSCAMVLEIPEIIESIVGLLSSVDVTIHEAHIESVENILEDAFLQDDPDQDTDAFDRMMDEAFELELQLQLEPDEHNISLLPLA